VSHDSVTVTAGIDASIDVVWQLLTAGRSAWWPEMLFEAVVGSPLVETWIEDGRPGRATGSVTRCDNPRLLGFRWIQQDWAHSLDVVIELVQHGRSTSVTLSESGFSRAPAPHSLAAEHEEGWRYHLARLKRVAEGGAVDVVAQ